MRRHPAAKVIRCVLARVCRSRRVDGYPASHSMDTEWYAIDRAGNVAVFVTGEAGFIPKGAAGDLVFDDNPGLFVYEFDEASEVPVHGPYARTSVPKRALHVDQLPPQLRKAVSQVRLD